MTNGDKGLDQLWALVLAVTLLNILKSNDIKVGPYGTPLITTHESKRLQIYELQISFLLNNYETRSALFLDLPSVECYVVRH